eukprot:Skav204589  [mRNA]  locus=scaffold672:90989:92262:+ [translate_table: standard]
MSSCPDFTRWTPQQQDLCICPAATYRPCYDADNNGQLRSECQCATGFYTETSSRCVGCPEGMVCEEGSDEQFFPCEDVDIVNSTVNPYPKPSEGAAGCLNKFEHQLDTLYSWSNPPMSSNASTFCRALGDKRSIVATASAALLVEHVMQASTSKQADAGATVVKAFDASSSDGSCNQCGEMEQSPLFLILPALVSPVFVFVLYKVSLADVHLWGRTGQGGDATMGQWFEARPGKHIDWDENTWG